MKTELIRYTADNIAGMKLAAEVIRTGGLVAFPTETVYGLGANGLDAAAVAGIYRAKGRPSDNPLILHFADKKMLAAVVSAVPDKAELLLRTFCPGPLTLILPRRRIVPDIVTGGLETVGVRFPAHPAARQLIALAGVPIAAPSANTSGRPSPTTAQMVLKDMDGRIGAVIDGGACEYGLESTIIDCTEDIPVILRPGTITWEMLEQVIGEVRLDAALMKVDAVPKAPGMKYTHYAPQAPMTLFEGKPDAVVAQLNREIKRLHAENRVIGLLVSEETAAQLLPAEVIRTYGSRDDLAAIGHCLYEALRSFDDQAVEVILCEGTSRGGVGTAIMNRMQKASGFRLVDCL